ncbi:MAG TPA: peptidylprolyl isomerase [Gemmatimonadaceae bacterium]|nr:peptidylprolyl isomerase [Gemmatimonadaceae bacterium]
MTTPRTLCLAALAIALAAPAAFAQNTPPPTSVAAKPPATRSDSGSLSVDRIAAIIGDRPILFTEVMEEINERRASRGLKLPSDSTEQMALARTVIQEMIDEEVIVQHALRDTSIHVADLDVQNAAETQIKRVRSQFKSDVEFAQALKGGGFGTPEEYKRWMNEKSRRNALQEKLFAKLRQNGKIVPVPVGEQDVNEAFEKSKDNLPKRPATVTFRQLVVSARASEAAKATARAKAESLLVEVRKGGDFEQIAKRESMDPSSKELGGDLGWTRRGAMVPAFERWMFALAPGQTSPVVETTFGYHIIRVDRVQPGEVKARHILIRPRIDSTDIAAAKLRADSASKLWQSGVPFDTLVARYHDRDAQEETGSLQPFDRTQLPESYKTAFEGKATGVFVPPFPIDDPARSAKKFVVAQIVKSDDGGEYTLSDFRNQIRDQLAQERGMRRVIDQMRKDLYVSVRI